MLRLALGSPPQPTTLAVEASRRRASRFPQFLSVVRLALVPTYAFHLRLLRGIPGVGGQGEDLEIVVIRYSHIV